MKIGLDIDDTTTNTRKIFQKELKKYRQKHKIKKYSETQQLNQEDFNTFLKENGETIYRKIKPKKNAVKVLKKWHEMGHEIYFITARSIQDSTHIERVTKEFFLEYQISYEKIIFNSKNKGADAEEWNLDVFIDDNESVLDTFQNKNVYQIRFLENKNNYSKYSKVSSWKELERLIEQL